MFKLQSPLKNLHLMQYTYRYFFPLLTTVLKLVHFDDFKCFWCFLFHLFHISRSHSGQDWVNSEGGAWGSCHFLVKNCWTLSMVWAGALVNHPSWNGQMCWKSLQKKIHWGQMQPLTIMPASTDADRFLEHSPSGGSLYCEGPVFQKIMPVFFGSFFVY